MLLSIVRTNILKRNGFIKTYLTSVSQTLLVKPEVVRIAVLLAEVCEGIFTARGLVVGFAVGFDGGDRLAQGDDVAFWDDEAGRRSDGLDTAAGVVGDHRRAARDRLQIDGRVVVLPGRVHEHIRR